MSKGQPHVAPLLNAATTTGAGSVHTIWNIEKSFQIVCSTSSGAGAATVVIQVSNNQTDWIDGATFDLEFSDTASSEGFTRNAPWKFIRGKVNSISGTGSSVTLTVSNLVR